MSDSPLALSFTAMPARFLNLAGHSSDLHATILGPTPRWTYIVEGIDVSARGLPLSMLGYYIGASGAVVYFAQMSTAEVTGEPAFVGTWRGRYPIGIGDVLEVGVQTTVAADLAIYAWGSILPYDPGYLS